MSLPVYEVYVIKYAERDARRPENFVGGDPHDAPMPMDYFVWLARSKERTVLIDTGFDQTMTARRNRRLLRLPCDALKLVGVEAAEIRDAVITHLHNDHVGTFYAFPNAKFHVQDDEMRFATGRHMLHHAFNRGYAVEHVTGMVELLFQDRLCFHDGDAEIAPGVSVHRIGGHTGGLQSVRVHTQRGWVVLASDASHYYEHFEASRIFPLVFNAGEVLEGYAKLRRLASSPRHVIPGHDPLVLGRYPAPAPELAGIVARLDVEPSH